jgi:ribosomal protein L23
MFVPSRIKKMSSLPNFSLKGGLNYLVRHVKRVVACDKYLLDPNVVVLDVIHDTDKRLMQAALDAICGEKNKVNNVRSLNRKSETKIKGKNKINTESFKRMYIKFDHPFDANIIIEGGLDDIKN